MACTQRDSDRDDDPDAHQLSLTVARLRWEEQSKQEVGVLYCECRGLNQDSCVALYLLASLDRWMITHTNEPHTCMQMGGEEQQGRQQTPSRDQGKQSFRATVSPFIIHPAHAFVLSTFVFQAKPFCLTYANTQASISITHKKQAIQLRATTAKMRSEQKERGSRGTHLRAQTVGD